MLGAAALCILAFQRLSHLSTIGVHKAPSSLWPYPPPDSSSYSDEEEHSSSFLRIGSHHHVFGNEIRIGLFRFVLPVLKKYPKSLLNDSYSSKESEDKEKKNLRVHEEKSRNRVALLVSIGDCREQTIQDAAVLRQSVPSKSRVHLYAIMNNEEDVKQCGDVIVKQGYKLLSASKLVKNLPASCLSEEESLLLLAHSLEMDTVVHVSLPAIVYRNKQDSSLPLLTDGFNQNRRKEMIRRKPTSITSIGATLRPQGPKVVKELLDGSITKYCEMKKMKKNHTSILTVDALMPWTPCRSNDGLTCRISQSTSVATLSHCPLPLFDKVNNRTDSTESQDCQRLREMWLDAKDS
jgi:hypothetical protein